MEYCNNNSKRDDFRLEHCFSDRLLAHRLVEAGHSVLFALAYRLVQDLLAAKRDPTLPRQLRKLDSYDFLLLDDLGYLPQGAEESEVLFTLIAERYERRSLGITSNLNQSQGEMRRRMG